ncbi:MAG: sodium:solute symporter family protein [Thermanaerothrix sp.]|nr:sodium:solute symporter family protein [Thermanaerothrix sp.]
MPSLAVNLIAFSGYTLAIILLTGQTFPWRDSIRRFYLGGRDTGVLFSTMTFCATWLSAASIIGFTTWMIHDGMVAFAGSVNGWLLGLIPMPFAVLRLRASRSVSVPEFVGKFYEDNRLVKLGGAVLLASYVPYIAIQFKAFGLVASHMLGIPYGFSSTALVYLFVLYTTFGGYQSVVKSDALNLLVIIVGVLVAAIELNVNLKPFWHAIREISASSPSKLNVWESPTESLQVISSALAWGLGVAANPQYGIRIMACRKERDAFAMLSISPVLIGLVYLLLSSMALIFSSIPSNVFHGAHPEGLLRLLSSQCPSWAAGLFFVSVMAAAVSTANSQLLLAASAVCYDIGGLGKDNVRLTHTKETRHDHWMLLNRGAILLIATVALLISHIPNYDIMFVGRLSWTFVAVFFLTPIYLPRRLRHRMSFAILGWSLLIHTALCGLRIPPEVSMLLTLGFQGIAIIPWKEMRIR